MVVVVVTVLGALIGASLFSGFNSGLWVGAAIGALVGWCLKLQQRLIRLESESAGRRLRGTAPPEPEPHRERDGAEGIAAARPGRAPGDAGRAPVARGAGEETSPPARARRAETSRPAGGAAEEPLAPASTVTVHAQYNPPPRGAGRERAGREPNDWPERLAGVIKAWFTTGNVPVKVGVVLSVFGLAFLIREAIDRSWLVVPISVRLFGVACFGAALLIIGWRLRERRRNYALSIQGGGIAVLYLTIYAAFAIYGLIPGVLSFAMLVAVTAAAGYLAVAQDAKALAVLGIVGGFMAPVLTSEDAGNHVLLFSYYAILNCAIFGIAWFKAWRALNVLGFAFTFVIGALWGYTGYQPSQFATTEPFLILFTLMYLAIPILFARLAPPRLRGFVDGTLVFGTPLIAFGLQAQLLGRNEAALALSSAALAIVYAALAVWLLRRGGERLRVLAEAFAGLALVFLTVTIPLALDAHWTSVAWALQGAAMVWLGWRQDRRLAAAAGIVLQALAAAAYVGVHQSRLGAPAVVNGAFLGAVVIAVAGGFSSRLFDRVKGDWPAVLRQHAAAALLVWASGWWLANGLIEIERVVPFPNQLAGVLIFMAATIGAASWSMRRLDWPRLGTLGVLLLPTLLGGGAAALIETLADDQPLADYVWIGWAAVFFVHFTFLRGAEHRFARLARTLHIAGFWAIALLLALEVAWIVERRAGGIWNEAAALAAISLVVYVTLRGRAYLQWPLAAHERSYVGAACGGVVAITGVWMLYLNLSSAGGAPPLPYLPLLNPLEIASVAFLIVAAHWIAAARPMFRPDSGDRRLEIAAGVFVSLLLLTMIVARSVHHYAGVPFDPERLAESDVFQAALSIVWGTTAIIGMIVGAQRRRRSVWIGGAALMAIVVIKLFLVELDNSGTVERVVSFLGVGLLLLVVGYFAPVPPRSGPPDNTTERAA